MLFNGSNTKFGPFLKPDYDIYWIKIHCVEPHSKIDINVRDLIFL
jgi:hypothetical protein